jgi:hypothetical protein
MTRRRTKTIREHGKVPMEELVLSPVLKRLARVLEHGNRKPGRGAFNWRRNRVLRSNMIAGNLRHIIDAECGADVDQESGEDPLVHAMARLFILLDAKEHGMLVDDRVTGRHSKKRRR